MVVSACPLDSRNPKSYIARANERVLPLTCEDLGFGGTVYHVIFCCHAISTSSFKGCPGCCLAWVAFPTALTLPLFLHAVLGVQSKK